MGFITKAMHLMSVLVLFQTLSFSSNATETPFEQSLNSAIKQKFVIIQPIQDKDNKHQELRNFYILNNFQTAWLNSSGWSPIAHIIAAKILQAEDEGLWLENYKHIAELIKKQPSSLEEQVDLELSFTKIVLDYIDDLFGGRLHPSRIKHELYMNPEPVNAAEILHMALLHDSQAQEFVQLTVNHVQYQLLKKNLQYYRRQAAMEKGLIQIPIDKTFKKGDRNNAIKAIADRLNNLGYNIKNQNVTDVFTNELEDVVKKLQHDHHLEADGIIGIRTALIINQSYKETLNDIIVNMERWRWLPLRLADRYIQVNIAAFELKAYNGDQSVLEMPVIIGQNYRHTPVFASKIDEIRFNPSWHVPISIAIKDKLKKLKENPQALADKGFVVYTDDGKALSPSAINWADVDAHNFNYHLVQSPGEQNALGKIRFNIDSPFGVYLHSTPDKDLFKKTVRNFSSGCIRVGEPNKLAVFVLNRSDEWPLDKVDMAMEGNETRNIKVKPPVPVYITYFTIDGNDQGHLNFYDDIYGQNALIWQELVKFKEKRP